MAGDATKRATLMAGMRRCYPPILVAIACVLAALSLSEPASAASLYQKCTSLHVHLTKRTASDEISVGQCETQVEATVRDVLRILGIPVERFDDGCPCTGENCPRILVLPDELLNVEGRYLHYWDGLGGPPFWMTDYRSVKTWVLDRLKECLPADK